MITPVAFDGDGSLIVRSNVGRDKYALFRYDPETKALGELIAEHPHVDIAGGLVYDPHKGRVVGVEYDAMRPEQAWFDEDWARVAAAVERALPNRSNSISRSVHGRLALVLSTSDVDPGAYYLLDLERRRMERLAAIRHDIKPDEMPSRQVVRYRARDGLEIPAILTLPRGKSAKNLPLVAVRAWRALDPRERAGNGATSRPSWRASGTPCSSRIFAAAPGWAGGTTRRASSNGAWRCRTTSTTASTGWWRKARSTPKRVCIMGGSYGGYAVMMGLARDPARWKCGINYVGVTDIQLMYDVTWSDYAYSSFLEFSAKDMMGDPVVDAAQLKATSPIEQADRIKSPC